MKSFDIGINPKKFIFNSYGSFPKIDAYCRLCVVGKSAVAKPEAKARFSHARVSNQNYLQALGKFKKYFKNTLMLATLIILKYYKNLKSSLDFLTGFIYFLHRVLRLINIRFDIIFIRAISLHILQFFYFNLLRN